MNRSLPIGSLVCAGGTIGSLLPPSAMFIMYGVLTENSIGTLFCRRYRSCHTHGHLLSVDHLYPMPPGTLTWVLLEKRHPSAKESPH